MLMLGGLLVSAALLTFAALTLVFRRPAPPRWTTRAGVGEMVTIALVSLLTFGIGCLSAGAIGAYQRGVDPIDLALFIVVVGAAVVAWRRLYVRRRLQEYAAAARANYAIRPGSAPAARPKHAAEPADLHAA